MSSPSSLYPQKVDLNNCDKEPIHILGKTQSYGVLLAFDVKSLNLVQYSDNLSTVFEDSFIADLTSVHDLLEADKLQQLTSRLNDNKSTSIEISIGGETYLLIAHTNADVLIFELEPKGDITDPVVYQQQLTDIVTELSAAEDEQDMCDKAAKLIRDFLGYDRVMIYRFDENWNGAVVSEARESSLESWLGLNYPATDIPQQARKLFLKQGVRIIADVDDTSVKIQPPLSPVSDNPLDLSKSELRAVSPIHIEYLQNMKVGATLTAAIVYKDTLWGLVACHHYSPKFINYYKRLSAKFLTQVFATQLGLRTSNTNLQFVNRSNNVRSTLIEQMSKNWNIEEGLTNFDTTLLDLTDAKGAAILLEGNLTVIGITPSENQIFELKNWLIEQDIKEEVFYTKSLSQLYSKANDFKDVAAGLMFIPISKGDQNALFWFKPERKETVHWAGNPDKAVLSKTGEDLSPRKSFEKWMQEVDGQSEPWQDYEIAAAKALKQNISEIIIQKYDEVKRLNDKLEKAYKELESFSYSVSHDLRAPLRGIDGFAQIIKEDYYDSLDDFGKEAVQTIISSTGKMNELIDDILAFSGLSQKETSAQEFSVDELIKDVLSFIQVDITYPDAVIKIHDNFPRITGDRGMIFQLFTNLISNALKYSSKKDSPIVEIGYKKEEPTVFYVKDNGIGFDTMHSERIFGVFNRLESDENYPGSGIGLAIVKRVVEKHNGAIEVESKPGEGSCFYFKLS